MLQLHKGDFKENLGTGLGGDETEQGKEKHFFDSYCLNVYFLYQLSCTFETAIS